MTYMKLFICGDSTAASYGPELRPLTGWGQRLPEYLPGVEIVNRAIAGRSTRTFIGEGRLEAVERELEAGSLMLVQFGHNDGGDKPERHTEPWGDFTDNLNAFVDAALRHDARPVLMTPICIRKWEAGKLLPSHGEYLDAIHALAQRRQVPLIDLYSVSSDTVRRLGDEASRALYMHLKPGAWPGWPDGSKDDTHTCARGAGLYARAVADALRDIVHPGQGEDLQS